MGWFWGSSDDKNASTKKDVWGDLDPTLRDFLAKESPVKYNSSNSPAESQPQAAPTTGSRFSPSTASDNADSIPKIPEKTLYKDGRYADLWKTYKPLAEIEAEGKSDQERMMDVIEGYKYRREEIGRIALENCALEQIALSDCFKAGGWKARATMCRDDNRKFDRCYNMQAKFLKALGYLDTFNRPPEVDERIQMQADTLYHRMLEQEEAIEQAKKDGLPPPAFPPLLAPRPKVAKNTPSTNPDERKTISEISDLRDKFKKPLEKRLEGLSGPERDVEEQNIKAEIAVGTQIADQMKAMEKKAAEERQIRKEQGRETLADKVASIFR
ncbi:hypothetical protein BGZ60DRAFT_520443 [Tricladium varicosporioides]|nr:hypothetical protein BGZ60DRAFT_520443 [Hymenoscyphus varicosporioides]